MFNKINRSIKSFTPTIFMSNIITKRSTTNIIFFIAIFTVVNNIQTSENTYSSINKFSIFIILFKSITRKTNAITMFLYGGVNVILCYNTIYITNRNVRKNITNFVYKIIIHNILSKYRKCKMTILEKSIYNIKTII